MKKICGDMIAQKADIIRDLIKIYADAAGRSTIERELAQYRLNINDLLKKKDRLLELSIQGRISDDEFEYRNNLFNAGIEEAEDKIRQLEEDREKNKGIAGMISTFRELISSELDFEEGISDGMVDAILDRIEVKKTDRKNVVQLSVYLKTEDKARPFLVKRKRGSEASVCAGSYT